MQKIDIESNTEIKRKLPLYRLPGRLPKGAKHLVFLDGPCAPEILPTCASVILELNTESQIRSGVQVLEFFYWPLIQMVQLLALIEALQPLTPNKDVAAFGSVPTLALTQPDEHTPATYDIKSALEKRGRSRSRTRRSSRSAKAGTFKRENRDGFLCLPV